MQRRPTREMRNHPSRLRGAPQDQTRLQSPEPPTRKVFNCIVDDTALMAGLKKNTRDGIRKWVNMGAIRLFVPLHSLEHLNRLSKGKDRSAADAREALRWLDDITSQPNIQSAGAVQLQGPDQIYNTWEEVEKYLLPETLLSMEDTDHESDFLSTELDALNMGESDEASMSSSQSLDNRPTTPSSPRSTYSANSPAILNASPYRSMAPDSPANPADRTARNSMDAKRCEGTPKGVIPLSLRPLFNHVLWLITQEENADAALATYILLTNDELKQTFAQRFGVRAKRLEQLRDIIAREDRDYKNRLQLFKKENNDITIRPAVTTTTTPSKVHREVVPEESASDDEDVVLLKPGARGAAATTNATKTNANATTTTTATAAAAATNGQRVMDPNEFSRGPTATTATTTTQQSPRGGGGREGGGGGGGRSGRGASRGGGRGGSRAPTTNGSTTNNTAAHQGTTTTNASTGRGVPRGPRAATDLSKPIDPDSFARPPPAARSLRGGRRKLWEPT